MNADVMVIIGEAQAAGLDVSPADVVVIDGTPTLDGMPVDEWCALMLAE
ncbi:hypothetical protein ACIRP5_10110 [Streptomyces sp. NPDC101221]